MELQETTGATQEEQASFSREEMEAYAEERMAEERRKAAAEERRKAEMSFAEREAELIQREERIARIEKREEICEILRRKNIPVEFAGYVDVSSKADMDRSIEEINTLVIAVCKQMIPGSTPKGGGAYSKPEDTFSSAFTAESDRPVHGN